MNKQEPLSKCCNAPITTEGMGDFTNKDRECTCYNKCTKCGKPCDIAEQDNRQEFEKKFHSIRNLINGTNR